MAGLASLHLMSACTETRYVIVSGDPQKYHGNNVTLQDVNGIVLGASTISGALAVTAGGFCEHLSCLTLLSHRFED
jgi:hypothetical protein